MRRLSRAAAALALTGALGGCVLLPVALIGAGAAGGYSLRGDGGSSGIESPERIVPTLEPSPVKGRLRCRQRRGEPYGCVGGIPGHARWCNDFLAINPGAEKDGNPIFRSYCLEGEVPPPIAELNDPSLLTPPG